MAHLRLSDTRSGAVTHHEVADPVPCKLHIFVRTHSGSVSERIHAFADSRHIQDSIRRSDNTQQCSGESCRLTKSAKSHVRCQ